MMSAYVDSRGCLMHRTLRPSLENSSEEIKCLEIQEEILGDLETMAWRYNSAFLPRLVPEMNYCPGAFESNWCCARKYHLSMTKDSLPLYAILTAI